MHGKHAADVCPLGIYWLLMTCVPIVNQECNPVAPNTEMSLALPFKFVWDLILSEFLEMFCLAKRLISVLVFL